MKKRKYNNISHNKNLYSTNEEYLKSIYFKIDEKYILYLEEKINILEKNISILNRDYHNMIIEIKKLNIDKNNNLSEHSHFNNNCSYIS